MISDAFDRAIYDILEKAEKAEKAPTVAKMLKMRLRT
jgi:hypothetical protein